MNIKSILNNAFDFDRASGRVYKDIFSPIYNLNAPVNSYVPEIYGKDGNQLEIFFIRDGIRAHNPYSYSKFYFLDRYNFALKTHFYSHNAMLQQMGNPDFKYGMLVESESIVPKDYEIFKKNKGLEKDFDFVFTQSEKILNEIPNARFVPFCSEVWYGNDFAGGDWNPEAYKYKSKNVSIVSSNKTMCHLHEVRLELARKCRKFQLADAYGTFDGGTPIKLAESLTDYRYSIAIENEISPYWFTERITSCFAAMTVPIYLGATKILDFFNPDGIIFINEEDISNIEKILSQCSEKDYEQRLPAIKENYEKAKQFICCGDYMYEHYLRGRK